MRPARPVIFAFLLVAALYYATTHHRLPFELPSMKPDSERTGKLEIIEAATPAAFDSEEQNNIAVYKKALPSVVNITSTAVAFDFFYGVMPQQGMGSGFVIDKDGHVLTNYHVIENARQIEVTLSNRKKYKAQLIGTDPSHDLAIVRITAPELTPATLGDSKQLQVGQKVYAIGNPFGLAGTMTRGIISSIRSIRAPDNTPIDDAIQTDAAINPGNSGGPLLNARGEVIGINSQILTGGANQSAGIGFAIPINTAKAVLRDLVTTGRVVRPALGVHGLPISPELASELGLAADYGVLVVSVVRGGPAERAGIRGGSERAYIGNVPVLLGGDLIVAIDEQEVTDMQDVAGAMNNHRAGDTVRVTIYRGKKKMQVMVTLGANQESS